MSFQKAERKQAKARIAFCAPAGGGKTHSSLLVAAGLGGRIAVIDTENGSASLEAGKPGIPDFDVLTLQAPFTVEKYISGMKEAESAGYDVIILDSISHAWQGQGGLLEQMDMKAKASKSGNSFAAWRDITPMHNAFVDAILQSKCHVIATMRQKPEYVLEKDEKTGRSAPKKIGLAPMQREGMDYEFTIVFDIDQQSHVALASKDRTSLFDGKPFVPSVETGKMISQWIMGGVVKDLITQDQLDQIDTLITQVGTNRVIMEDWAKRNFQGSIQDLTQKQAIQVIESLQKKLIEKQKPVEAQTATEALAEAQAPQSVNALPPKDTTGVYWMNRAKACKDQYEAGEIVLAMVNEKVSEVKLGAVKGILASRGFTA
jgi:hypothetical protein